MEWTSMSSWPGDFLLADSIRSQKPGDRSQKLLLFFLLTSDFWLLGYLAGVAATGYAAS
jgi:hypothetical protein